MTVNELVQRQTAIYRKALLKHCLLEYPDTYWRTHEGIMRDAYEKHLRSGQSLTWIDFHPDGTRTEQPVTLEEP